MSDSNFDFHHQHKDADQQKLIDAFHKQAVNCPGVKTLAGKCPYLVEKQEACPFVKKLVSPVSPPLLSGQGAIFAP